MKKHLNISFWTVHPSRDGLGEECSWAFAFGFGWLESGRAYFYTVYKIGALIYRDHASGRWRISQTILGFWFPDF